MYLIIILESIFDLLILKIFYLSNMKKTKNTF